MVKIIGRLALGVVAFLVVGWLTLIVYAYWPTGIDEVPARQLATPADRFVTVEGLELRYRELGVDRPGEPSFVFLHGFGNSLQSFRLLAPALAEDFHVITVDMPGFGLSAKPADWDYRNPSQARMMIAFIRELGLDNVVVSGHSLGGAIALRVAVGMPEIHGLVLMNPGIVNTGVPAIAQYYVFPLQRLFAKQFGDRGFREAMLKRSFIDPSVVTDEVMDNLMRAVRSEGYLASATTMMGQYVPATELPLLHEVEVPTLIVWGEQDRGKSPEELETLRAGLSESPAVEVLKVPNAGHYVHEEAPRVVADGLRATAGLWRRR